MYKLLALGVDNKIHCVSVADKSMSCCEDAMPIKRVNPDFSKLSEITWCYECSSLIGEQDFL